MYNPATQRTERLLYNTQEEVKLGAGLDQELQKQLKISNNTAMKSRLERIGKKIAAASDRQDLVYYFRIVEDKDLNAFAIPGGYVYVHTALMESATDDELACVLAHEVGHIAAKHSIKQMQGVLPYQITMAVVAGVTGAGDAVQLVDMIIANPLILHYSRTDELFADKLSVRYSRRADFNPYGSVTFFEKLKKEAQNKGPALKIEILSSHPDLDKRIKLIKEEIALTK